MSDRVTFRSPFQPYGAYYVFAFIGIITITNGYAVFFSFDIGSFLAPYITIPIVLVLYAAHKIYSYVYLKQNVWLIPIEDIDLVTGLDLVEEEDLNTPDPIPKNWIEKFWFCLA